MPAIYIQCGDIVDHIPDTDLALGAVVVLGTLIGIAHRPIPVGQLGSLAIEGIVEVPIVGAPAPAWSPVFWDRANATATTDSSTPGVMHCGLLTRPLVAADTTARILINR